MTTSASRLDTESRIVWLLGSPRSGSTWLLRLLARATGGATLREPMIGAHLGLSLGGLLGLPVPDDPLVMDAMADRTPYFFARDAAEVWRPALRTLLVERIALDARRHEAATGRAADPIVVKDPWGPAAAPVLLETLPRSRLLFLVRDGRDVVDSLLDGADDGWITTAYGVRIDDPSMRERALREMALFWVRSVEAVQRAFDRHPPGLRLDVRYEDLRTDTGGELRRILRWLDRADLLDQVENVTEGLQFSKHPEATGPGKFLRAGASGLWREHFTLQEQMQLDELMGPTLETFGYI